MMTKTNINELSHKTQALYLSVLLFAGCATVQKSQNEVNDDYLTCDKNAVEYGNEVEANQPLETSLAEAENAFFASYNWYSNTYCLPIINNNNI